MHRNGRENIGTMGKIEKEGKHIHKCKYCFFIFTHKKTSAFAYHHFLNLISTISYTSTLFLLDFPLSFFQVLLPLSIVHHLLLNQTIKNHHEAAAAANNHCQSQLRLPQSIWFVNFG
jgi:hypothetical protein